MGLRDKRQCCVRYARSAVRSLVCCRCHVSKYVKPCPSVSVLGARSMHCEVFEKRCKIVNLYTCNDVYTVYVLAYTFLEQEIHLNIPVIFLDIFRVFIHVNMLLERGYSPGLFQRL